MLPDFSSDPGAFSFLFYFCLGLIEVGQWGCQDGPHDCVIPFICGPARYLARPAGFFSPPSLLQSFQTKASSASVCLVPLPLFPDVLGSCWAD